MLTNRFRGSALLCIFAASGFAGLIYQSIWSHYVSLILGHSAYAQVLVLALFMGGMALGAWLISRRNASLKMPLRNYAMIEFALGIFGVGFHLYYQSVSSVSYTTLFPALGVGLPLEIGRWLVAGFLILPQCVLLGMTFPLMSSGYLRWNPGEGGKVLAGLYFTNSMGAALGALFSTYALLPSVGLPGTTLAAGIVNIFVAILVWPLAQIEQPTYTRQDTPAATKSLPAFILLVAAITGASSFVYEIAWVRMLSMVLGSTIHAFELMLASFIAGMALGGMWLRKRADRFASPCLASGWAQVIKGCMALSTLFLYNYSFTWMEWLMQVLNRSAESSYVLFNIISAGICMVIMVPTAFFAGMTLPLLTLTLLKDGADEAAIGKVYAANTLGAIVGVVLVVYLGLPFLGLRLSLWSGAAADIVIGILLLASLRQLARGKVKLPQMGWKTAVGISVSVLILALSVTMSHFDTKLMNSGVFRHGALRGDRNVLFHKDGRTASVALFESGKTKTRIITTNGKPDAGLEWTGNDVTGDEGTMALAAVLPMLYHPEAKTAANIGFGSGMTTHFVLGNPDIDSVDTIEIEPAMVEAAHYFRPLVERAYTDPRSHIIIDDAKSYFATNQKRYDIIISEPSNPWVSGVASLFTEEFYQFIPQHLTEDGLFVQWIQMYEISPALINTILKAMLPHFADVQMFQANQGDWIILASPHKKMMPLKEVTFPANWDENFLHEIARRGVANISDLYALYMGNKELLQTYTALYPEVGRNSDFFPVLQLNAPQARFRREDGREFLRLKSAPWPLLEVMTFWRPAPEKPQSESLLKYVSYGKAVMGAHALRAVLTGRPLDKLKDYIPFGDKMTLEYIRLLGLACRLDSLEVESFVTLTNVAAATIPYLQKEYCQELWITPSWLKCPPKNPLLRDYLGFLASVAARDHQTTLRLGEQILLVYKESLSMKEMKMVADYVMGAMEMAAYALGEYEKVLTLDEKSVEKQKQNFVHAFIIQAAKEKMGKNRPE